MGGLAHQYRPQGVPVHIGVVGQHAGRCYVQGRVFGRGETVIDCDRRVVDAGDGDGDRGNSGVGLAGVGLVGEAVGPVVVGRRGVTEAAVAVQGQAAMRGLADQHRAQSVAVHITVVGEHTAGGHVQGGVFGGAVAVVDGDGRVVDAGDGDG